MGGWINCGELSGGSIGGCQNDGFVGPRNSPNDEYENGNSKDDRCEPDDADDEKDESVYELYDVADDGGSEAESLLIRRRFTLLVSDPSNSDPSPLENRSASDTLCTR